MKTPLTKELNFIEKLQLVAMHMGIAFLRFLGFRGVRLLGIVLGRLTWYFLPSRRRYARSSIERHLKVCSKEARRIAKSSFSNNFCSFMEAALVKKFHLNNNPHLLEYDKNFQRLLNEEKAIVATTAHLGGWELLAGLLPYAKPDKPQVVVVRKQRSRAANALIFNMRGASGGEVVAHRNAAPTVMKVLRQQGITAFLVDHNASKKESVFIPFLGESASVNIGPAMLALRAKAMVYPIFLIRRPGLKYEIVTHTPLDTASLEGSIAERAHKIAEFYTQAVEKMVCEYPEQWFWMHKRWKTQLKKQRNAT